ncbi:MAG: flavin reductase family protein [Hyphomicrobiaceae bacterium]
MDATKFKNLMRHQAGAVTIITVGEPGNRTGLTATAMCSLSDTPPTVLICVNRNASAHAPIRACKCFAVNILAQDHHELGQSASPLLRRRRSTLRQGCLANIGNRRAGP